jgi:TatD DNase family protein
MGCAVHARRGVFHLSLCIKSATVWIDTHCHLDAPEFIQSSESDQNRLLPGTIIDKFAINNIAISVIPAVEKNNFSHVRELAHTQHQAYALGIHPLYVPQAHEDDLRVLDAQLDQFRNDPRLVAVGEIGLDFFVPALCEPVLRKKQTHFYRAQLKLASKYQLPVIVHVRKSADQLLHGLREIEVAGGIAHAFNGSQQQAEQFLQLGFALGFGGAVTYERALHLRELAQALPPEAIVMETDSPDIPPHWLYVTAQERAAGQPQGINTPLELPRIGEVVAALRGASAQDWAAQTTANAKRVLPKLRALL